MGHAAVAKKKSGPKPKPEGPRDALIAMKCRQQYKDWLVEVARKYRTTPSQLIDRVIFEFAEREGLKPPPDR